MKHRRSYTFRVHGCLPPKKGMDLSMFGKPGEAEKVVALRKSAAMAMQGAPPLVENISLFVSIHVGRFNDRMTGDLDNFITGICDGLMAAMSNAKIAPVFNQPKFADIYPDKAIGLLDDSQVVEISARKLIGDTLSPWYEVTIEGE